MTENHISITVYIIHVLHHTEFYKLLHDIWYICRSYNHIQLSYLQRSYTINIKAQYIYIYS